MKNEKKGDSYIRGIGEQKLTKEEKIIMDILFDFGMSIDSQGASDGNYDKATKKIMKLLNKKPKK